MALVSGVAQRVKIRLFVEGVEIPCISASIQAAPNSPLMCSMQIIPLAEATEFLPRSLVHLFFIDEFEDSVPNIRSTNTSGAPGPTVFDQVKERQGEVPNLELTDSDVNDYRLQKYKLIFVGELMGFSWTKTPRNRSIVLQCADLSNYWDYAYQHNNTDLFGPGYKAMFSGGSTNLFTDLLDSPGSIASKILQSPSTRYPELKGLLGGIVHLLEAMGGSYYYGKKYAGQNLFFSIAELRLHLTQMITAFEKDPTSSRLMGGGWDPLFGRSLGNLGDQASFRTIVNKLSSFIFHETYAQPCPRYVPGTAGTVSGFVRKKLKAVPELVGYALAAQALKELCAEGIDLLSSGPLKADVRAFSDRLRAAIPGTQGYARSARALRGDFAEVGGRLAGLFSSVSSALGVARASIMNTRVDTSPVAEVAQEQRRVEREQRQRPGADREARKKADRSGYGLPDPPVQTREMTEAENLQTWKRGAAELTKALRLLEAADRFDVQVSGPRKNVRPAQLKQQIFRPDVWFSAPPRCNVLFPDHYTQVSYARQFMAEPTRLMLKTHDEFFGEDELFDNFYFAPKAITVKAEKNTLSNILKNDVMDHELFTGILPVFEKMGEFNIFGARSGVVDGKVGKVGMAQRATNFLYFKYRFAARQLSVSCRFNPFVAPGFPGLIIDKHIDLNSIKTYNQAKGVTPQGQSYAAKLPPLMGVHYLANFTEVSHHLSNREGQTNIACSYARKAGESVEFLGAQQETVSSVVKSDAKKAVRATDVAAIYPPRVGSMGPGQGRIVGVEDVTPKYASGGTELPLLGADRDKKTKQLTIRVPVGQEKLASEYGAAVVPYIGDANIFVTFRAFKVTETVAKETVETVFLPPEEYIRPGWYGDCWAPSKISEVYYDFLATGSITEAMQIQNTDGDFSKGLYASNDPTTALNQLAEAGEGLKLAKDQILALSQTKDATVADAVALLVLTYSVIKTGGFDPEAFIKSYTWRPIATLLDMFGSNDLTLSTDGEEVLRGIEGFHSRAFGDFENLFGLVPSDVTEILGIPQGSPTSKRADTRKRKRDKVLEYKAVLDLGNVLLG